ncbi:guanylate kinase [Candidatus Dependentiae bacterium]|nr:guanylate kinase [Candidatus Dependentiae bacterium]
MDSSNKGKLFIISAPSGAGKTTLANEIIRRLSDQFNISKVITWTTRSPRPGESEGKDYHFTSREKFEEKRKNDFFLETTKYNGELYGSPKDVLEHLELGKSFIIVTDLYGVNQLKKITPHAIFFWIKAPNLEELKTRLIKRKTLDKNDIEKRLELAKKELKEADKPRLFDYNIVNDDFDKTVNEISLLIKKELVK